MRSSTVISVVLAISACVADSSYDPDWQPDAPLPAITKADNLFDILPELTFAADTNGHVGGSGVDLYKISLRRADRIELTMTVTSGDLDPHTTLYYGTSTYVGSESWRRDGNVLKKEYKAESAGLYLVAASAYRGRGDGTYSLAVRCLGGPCAGETPVVPATELGTDDVAWCIERARVCAFEKLPSLDGRVGSATAGSIMTDCLGAASLRDGTSCSTAKAWVNPEDESDKAADLIADIAESLVFYADQPAGCLTLLNDCMDDCLSMGEGESDDGALAYTALGLCWANGFNGTCDGYARKHASCGGEMPAEGGLECVEYCHATTGAFTDDLDTLCSSDTDCEDRCGVEVEAAGAACGGLREANRACLEGWASDRDAWICEEAISEAISG